MSIWAIFPITFFGLGAVTVPMSVGKQRKPMTGGMAATILLADAFLIFCMVMAGMSR